MLNLPTPPALLLKTMLVIGIVMCGSIVGHAGEVSGRQTRILFLGDSLTAGYGLSLEEAYPEQVAELARAEKFPLEAVNGGVSGDTTAGALRRLPWLLKKPSDIYVVALGANDGLRGLDLKESRENLVKIIRLIREKSPEAPIMLMQIELPPNFGPEYTQTFRSLYKSVADSERVHLGPFLLKDVAGNQELNQPDRLHPTAAGQKILAKTVWDALKPLVSSGFRSGH